MGELMTLTLLTPTQVLMGPHGRAWCAGGSGQRDGLAENTSPCILGVLSSSTSPLNGVRVNWKNLFLQ
jgi:hypothetical protein